jgi:hypothetical protein
MPEFEEESNLSVVAGGVSVEIKSDTAARAHGDESTDTVENVTTSEEERARCALKRGRMPASVVQKKTSQKSVSVDDVCKDAIGTRKNEPAAVHKSTTIVEKDMNNNKREKGNRDSCSCRKHGERSITMKEKGSQKQDLCKCKDGALRKLIKKILHFFGLHKKCEQCEQKPRQYRRRSYNQRKSNGRSSHRQIE